MSSFITQLALVSETNQIGLSEVLKISAALQKQITRDFGPLWDVRATIDAFARLEDVPVGYWPIVIKDSIPYKGAAGIHLDRNGQPYALVRASDGTPLTCSHECLEMLADPFGNRFVTGDSPIQGQGRVQFLLEVCDPSEADRYGYPVNGMILSDFYTPQYFDPVANSSVRYSFTNSISRPREVLPGGYLSWRVPETGLWWQATYFGGGLVRCASRSFGYGFHAAPVRSLRQ